MKEFLSCIKDKYVCFSGRARRREYWMFYLFYMIFYIASTVVGGIVNHLVGSIGMVLPVLFILAMILPSIGVFFRRLHDTGRSGWWWLIGLVPFVGGIILLVFMCLDSQPGENRFGPNPKGL